MSIQPLLDALLREAEAAARVRLDAAAAEAAAIARAAEADRSARRSGALRAHEEHVRGTGAGERARRRAGAAGASLAARERFVERVLDRAHEAIDRMMDDEATAGRVIARLIEEAVVYLGGEPGVVRCQPRFADAARRAAGGRLRVEPDPAVPAGVRLAAADGSVVIDATLAARLHHARRELAIELVAAVPAAPPAPAPPRDAEAGDDGGDEAVAGETEEASALVAGAAG